MASLNMALGMTATRGKMFVAKAGKSTGSRGNVKEEKGLLEWIIGSINKEDQLMETDPILKKVEDGKPANSVSIPPKKKPGFGGLFAKN